MGGIRKPISNSEVQNKGGIVTEDDEKMLEGRDFGKLVGMICEMDFPDEEDYECSMLWSVQFRNEEDEVVEELEPGCWNMELLKNVIVCFDNFLNDDEVMAQFREVLEW